MKNQYNPKGKDIRFINSRYTELFRIPDGGYIQIDSGNDCVIKPCTYIDEYHTQIANQVFHICEFAQIMERNGYTYQAEPPIMGDEAAWSVGKYNYLAIQACEEGYDYSFLDHNFKTIDGGQINVPHLTMVEVRNQLLSSFSLEHCELRAIIFEEMMEKANAVTIGD